MEHGQLLSHVDTDLVSRAELRALSEPEATRTFKPIPHVELVDMLELALREKFMQQEALDFHIRQNDYFGTLATVLDLMRQDLRRLGHRGHDATLAHLRDELMYLQRSYRIENAEP